MKRTALAPGFVVASIALQAQPAAFITQTEFHVGRNPAALAIGEFRGDGKQGLLVANEKAATVTLMRGVGKGFFEPLNTVDVGISPDYVAVGDFNGDGRLDAVVANFASNSVSVLLGNGDGTFRAPLNVSARGPVALAVADFNGDGRLDVAVAEFNSNTVTIFLGKGDGTLLRISESAVGKRPSSLAVGDSNHDGKLDLAVTNNNSNSVSVLIGLGNGAFWQRGEFSAGELPAFVVSADFNLDGKPDLAVANANGFSTSSVSILLGNGEGSFQAPLFFAAGNSPTFLAVADFDRDGKLDLAVTNTDDNAISILMGIGNGRFQPARKLDVGSGPDWITVADLNGDGKQDLLVANRLSDTVSVLLNVTAAGEVIVGVSSIVNAASFETGPIVPGEMVTIFGSNLGPEDGLGFVFTNKEFVSSELAGTQLFFDGIPAPLLFVNTRQLTALVPYAISGRATTQMTVKNKGLSSSPITIPVSASAPAVFTAAATGRGPGAILNQDGSLNSESNPAARGSFVMFYATGAGETDPPGIDGLLADSLLPQPLLPVSVTIGGQAAEISYVGAAPGVVSGIVQVNVRIPDGVGSGAVPVQLRVGDQVSQAGVTVNVE